MEYKELRFPDISINTVIVEAASWDRKNAKARQFILNPTTEL